MKKALLLIILISFTGVLFAAPADTTWQTKTQSNGQTITYSLRGDEFLHWAISQDGHTLLYDALGDLVYATLDDEGNLIPSSIIASDNDNRKVSFAKDLFFSKKQIEKSQKIRQKRDEIPPEVLAQKTKANNGRKDGTKKMLVILVNFPAGPETTVSTTETITNGVDGITTTESTDENGIKTTIQTTISENGTKKTTTTTTQEIACTFNSNNITQWTNQISNSNYTTNNATGSVKDYYSDNTNNNMNIDFSVVGPYILPYPRSHYGRTVTGSRYEDTSCDRKFARDAIDLLIADNNIDLYQFANEKHFINNVFMVYAGKGKNNGGGINAIWAHQFTLSSTLLCPANYDNYSHTETTYRNLGYKIYFYKYGCSPELTESSTCDGVGTACHELGHLLGLPDIYDVDKEGSGGISVTAGSWDLMANGNYNNSSKTPPSLTALERDMLYWDVFDKVNNVTIKEITKDSVFTISPIRTGNLDYKINLSDNEYLLLENRDLTKWDLSTPAKGLLVFHVNQDKIDTFSSINTNPNNRGFYIEPASGTDISSANTVFGSSSNITSKSPFNLINGFSLNRCLNNITSHENNDISVSYQANDKLNVLNTSSTSVTLGWNNGSNQQWNIAYCPNKTLSLSQATTISVTSSPYTITGLTPNTAYSFAVKRSDMTNWTGIACAYTNIDGMKGAGTESNPYQITYKEDLLALSKYIANGNGDKTEGKYFVLTRDIYFPNEATTDTITLDETTPTTKSNFIPIGGVNKVINGTNTFYPNNNNKAYCFQGVFDGKGYTIHNLRVKRNTNCATGNEDKVTTCAMFGRIFNATIQNLSIVDGTFTGYSNVSAFVGSIDHNYSSDNTESTNYISSCVAIDNTLTAYKNCAGFVGYSENNADHKFCFISNCYSTSNITATSSQTDYSTFAPFANTKNNPNAFSIYGFSLWRHDWINITSICQDINNPYYITWTADNNSSTGILAFSDYEITQFANNGTSFYKDNDAPFQVNKGFILPYKSPTSYTISNNTTFTLNNTSTATPKIIIEDGSSFINNTAQSFNGIVERKANANKWNMYGDCLSSDLTAEVLNNNLSLSKNKLDMVALKWNNTTNNWSTSYVNSLSAPIYKDSAILIYPLQSVYVNNDISVTDNSTTTTMTQEGELFNLPTAYNSNDVTTNYQVIVTNSGSSETGGTTTEGSTTGTGYWAMLSNPYPAKLYISKFLQNNTTQGQGVYILNSNGTNYSFVNGNTATIDKMDGFAINVIQSSSKTVSQTFNFNKTQLVEASSKQTNNITPLCDMITFITNNGGNLCQAYLNINPQAKNSFDIWDAYRMANSDTSIVTPYFVIGDKEIMKNEIKTLPYECGIDFLANKTSNISFYAKNIPNDVEVYLVDTVNDIETSLNNNNICQLLLNQGSNKDKYIIRFAPNTSLNDTLNKEDLEVSLYPNPANTQTTLNVEGLKEKAIVVVNDVAAREIYRTTITPKDSSLKISTKSFAAGVYYIKVVTSLSTKTQKLIVK